MVAAPAMRIPSGSYPVVRPQPSLPAPPREATETPQEAASAAQTATREVSRVTPALELAPDMLRASLRGRSGGTAASFANQQALAEYQRVAQQDESGNATTTVAGLDIFV